MSGNSNHISIGDSIGLVVLLFVMVAILFAVVIITFLCSPGMAILGAVKMALGASWSTRQMWVLAAALSLMLTAAMCLSTRDVSTGMAAYLALCVVSLGGWVVATYGLEMKAGETVASLYFSEFTIHEKPAMPAAKRPATPEGASTEGPALTVSEPDVRRVPAIDPGNSSTHSEKATEREPLSAPTCIPMATLRVALRLPLMRAYVMVRLNDREVFRADFRPGNQSRTPELVTPAIQVAPGPAELKVWVISPDKQEADEYVLLSMKQLKAGESRRMGLVFDSRRDLKSRLVAEPPLLATVPTEPDTSTPCVSDQPSLSGSCIGQKIGYEKE